MDDEGTVVRRLESRNGVGPSVLKLSRALDHEHEVRFVLRLQAQRVLERADDVLSLDRHVLVRRRVANARLEPEGVRKPVLGDLRQGDGEIRSQDGPARFRRRAAVVDERPEQTAALQLGDRWGGIDLRGIRGRERLGDPDAQRAAARSLVGLPRLLIAPTAAGKKGRKDNRRNSRPEPHSIEAYAVSGRVSTWRGFREEEADDGIRTHDLLHGKQTLAN